MDSKNYIGIEIGGSKLQIVLGDEKARILERFRFEVDRNAGAEKIQESISETARGFRTKKISGIGVGFGGPVDRVAGKIWESHQIQGWSGFPLKRWLEELTGVPVSIDNDANAAALGESLYGAGKDRNIVLYITLGSGVGGGVVADKKIYRGAAPGEVEIGHIRLDKTGRTLESACSGWAADQKIRDAVRLYPESALSRFAPGVQGAEAKLLRQALEANDALAIRILDEICDDLAFGVSHAVHLFHPETVILGGGLSLIGEPLRIKVAQKLIPYLMDAFQPGPLVRLSILKEDAVPVGALALAIQDKP